VDSNIVGIRGDTMRGKEIKVIYVSGPITNGGKKTGRKHMLKHVMHAVGIGITLIRKGYAPIVPHLDWLFGWHPKGKMITWEDFLNWDLAVIEKCDAVLRLKGKSKGADIEVRYAKRRRKPVFYSLKDLYQYTKENV
jgi:hypothetical protein